MERRLSSNSESSIEPMEVSGKTASTDEIHTSITATRDTDHIESEEAFESDERAENDFDDHDEADADADVDEDDENGNSEYNETNLHHGHIVRRENLRQLENNMRKKFRFASNNERMPNNNNTNKNNNNSKVSQRIDSNENSADANGNVTTSQYSCPICGVCSATQHEFTEHIRGHNNSDGSHNYTCQICFKVRILYQKIQTLLFSIDSENEMAFFTFANFIYHNRLYHLLHLWIAMYSFTLVNAHLHVNIVMSLSQPMAICIDT